MPLVIASAVFGLYFLELNRKKLAICFANDRIS
jgi:hypothetical protein